MAEPGQAARIRAIRRDIVPRSAKYTEPEPGCGMDYVPNEAREQPVRVALSNSFGFGRMNVVLMVKRI